MIMMKLNIFLCLLHIAITLDNNVERSMAL